MNSSEGDFFELPKDLPLNFELFQSVFSNDSVSIERIISTGQCTPSGQWLEQNLNEWVLLLQGESELLFDDGRSKVLTSGQYILIPKNTRHRVVRTSSQPACVWLAIHYP